MRILQLYQDHGIQYWTEGKNVGVGWVNVTCPFCQDVSNHLGFNLKLEYFRCWRCGYKPLNLALARLLNVDENAVATIIREYGGKSYIATAKQIKHKAHQLPSGVGPMDHRHKQYLQERNFDPDLLAATWGLLGTGPVALLDHIDYKHRIVAPIIWDGEQVSFQTRDVTGRHPLRYISCPKNREVVPHKEILYGRTDLWTDVGICVEGITDVWRLGPVAFATFGIEYTQAQVLTIAARFKRVTVLFDADPPAQRQAARLVGELRFMGLTAQTMAITAADPASLSQPAADRLVKTILR